MPKEFFAAGKLLLSGEYAVLKGAECIAVPTFLGQRLSVKPSEEELRWRALNEKDATWLDFQVNQAKSEEELLVQKLLRDAFDSYLPAKGLLESKLEFPREWGLGSSSTFVSLISQWAETEVWPLFFKHLKGSGYDVAVAERNNPILYQINKNRPKYEDVNIPSFFGDTLLIYLGQKQNSAKEVSRFQDLNSSENLLEHISGLSRALLNLLDRQTLGAWIKEHEAITSELIHLEPLKAKLFPNLEGEIKSLGAWGGDFAWYAGPLDKGYFQKQGFPQVFSFKELVKI